MTIDRHDWTASAAKWVVVLMLGGSSIYGIAWTIRTRPRAPAPIAPIAPASPDSESRTDRTSSPHEAARPGPVPNDAGPSKTNTTPIQPAPRLININTASAAELELLPQIGPTLAGRIVADREANGPFTSLDDLERVRGIGPRTVEKFRDLAVAR